MDSAPGLPIGWEFQYEYRPDPVTQALNAELNAYVAQTPTPTYQRGSRLATTDKPVRSELYSGSFSPNWITILGHFEAPEPPVSYKTSNTAIANAARGYAQTTSEITQTNLRAPGINEGQGF